MRDHTGLLQDGAADIDESLACCACAECLLLGLLSSLLSLN